MSKCVDGVRTKVGMYFGINLAGACLLARWHPAYRWRELDLGFYTELREPILVMAREKTQAKHTARSKVSRYYIGTDKFVVVMKSL